MRRLWLGRLLLKRLLVVSLGARRLKTPAEIIYHRRVRVLEHAAKTDVAKACRAFGVSRTTFYRWKKVAKAYGLAALMKHALRALGRRWLACSVSIMPAAAMTTRSSRSAWPRSRSITRLVRVRHG